MVEWSWQRTLPVEVLAVCVTRVVGHPRRAYQRCLNRCQEGPQLRVSKEDVSAPLSLRQRNPACPRVEALEQDHAEAPPRFSLSPDDPYGAQPAGQQSLAEHPKRPERRPPHPPALRSRLTDGTAGRKQGRSVPTSRSSIAGVGVGYADVVVEGGGAAGEFIRRIFRYAVLGGDPVGLRFRIGLKLR